ncbi:MAG: NAD(P)-binding protein [Bacteroidales bacterium]|nr:NAD(P)-binding protein [Bacteroidales bacterium]
MSEAVIIGSGLGGLLSGAILSRAGYRVTVLEKAAQPGGCLQTFTREGLRFDTGFHSVAGLEEGGPLERIFRPLGLMDLPWEQVSETDEIVLDGVPHRLTEFSYPIGNALRLSGPDVTEEEYAHVMEPYKNGSWRLPSGDLLVHALAAQIDGTIRCNSEVTAIEPGLVRCKDGSSYAGTIVSDIHPRQTFALFQGHVRPAYLHRLNLLEDGPGIFTVYCKLRPETLVYKPWSTTYDNDIMVQYGNPDAKGFARSADLLTFCEKEVPDRASLAESLIRRVPGLEPAVVKYWTSTPATWERYTGTPSGSAFGIRKKDATCYVHPRTPVPGLYLTGQNCGLHGVLGVAETALTTCREILGASTLNQILQR